MILTKKIKILSNNCKKSHYQKLGYDTTKEDFYVNVLDLPKRSAKIIRVLCDVCGKDKEISFGRYNLNTFDMKEEYCCSRKCAQNKSERRLEEKYGVNNVFQLEDIKDKIKIIKKEKWGDENYKNYEKRKITCLEKYGENSPLSNKEVRNKIRNTCLERYKVDCITKVKKIKNIQDKKSKITKFEKSIIYYKENYDLNLIGENGDSYIFMCKKGHDFEINKKLLKNRLIYKIEVCTVCNRIGHSFISNGEKELFDFLSNYIDDLEIQNRKIIYPYHLDIVSEKLKLAFEFNGVYWHNENYKGKDYHRDKSDICLEKGYNLIHIWEDEWNSSREIVKSNILEFIGYNYIKIENYEIREICKEKALDFLIDNSLKRIECKKSYGLFHKEEMLSVLIFNKNGEYIIENKNFHNLDKFYYFKDLIQDKIYIMDRDYEKIEGEVINYSYNIKNFKDLNIYKSGILNIRL